MSELLKVTDACFEYEKKHGVLDGINMQVGTGEVFCIVGPNGCGKSTLIDCILGLNKLHGGKIEICGRDIKSYKDAELARHVSYVPQNHKPTFGYSVLEVVSMGRAYTAGMFSPPDDKDREIARESLRRVGLYGFEDRDYTRLSGGELQLVLIARALTQKSDILVMDEPTAHLDFRHELKVMEIVADLVKTENLTIIMATHFLNQAYYLENAGVNTKVALMENGIFGKTGTPSDVLTTENLKSVFSIETEIATDAGGSRKYVLPLRNI